MKKIFVLLLFYCAHFFVVKSQATYWQQQVNYTIDVSLNDVDHTLDGYIKMHYFNNSPDTLFFIWIHVWPNAYKNDRTAFSDQLLENGRTDFYFSDNDKRGYINRLDFKVNGSIAKMEDHPQHQDIIKVVLPAPLLPGNNAMIETPFHVKLPYTFSRGGHVGRAYQITQWYPKPAVYDSKGWHAIPYLDQGEFYSEFGNYQVQITLPKNYVVAATGELQTESEKEWLKTRQSSMVNGQLKKKATTKKKNTPAKKTTPTPVTPPKPVETKTLVYKQDNVHDFAWFADKRFIIREDTLLLPSGRVINLFSYALPDTNSSWVRSIEFMKRSVLTRSNWLGEYPYNVISAVEAKMGFEGGMEYPTITSISPGQTPGELESVLEHEIGHNWNYGILGSNEREHSWMDEGINTFYDNRYEGSPEILNSSLLQMLYKVKKDQPIETPAEKFTLLNSSLVAYNKTSDWMRKIEKDLGQPMFDSCMHEYYQRWKFKHPYPEDFKKVIEEVSGKNMDSTFGLLGRKGDVNPPVKKTLRVAPFIGINENNKHNYLCIAPAIGYNVYDQLMFGPLIHNYSFPIIPDLHFFGTALYGVGSKQFNGMGRIGYTWYPGNEGKKMEFAIAGASFNYDTYTDSTGKENIMRFSKIVPSVKYVFAGKNARSTVTSFIQWKTFLISEQQLLFSRDTINEQDIITYPKEKRYLNQLRFVIENERVLYPYSGEFQVEQANDFVRAAFTGNYFFNYAKGGGVNVRLFAGKFFYLGDKTYLKQFETDRYQLNMTGPRGYEDYTYSNYFIGRNQFDNYSSNPPAQSAGEKAGNLLRNAPSQQLMIRDGAFKVGTDQLSSKVGKTDNWLTAVNFTSTIPKKIDPLAWIPARILSLKAFLDIGTYAEAWKKDAPTGKFIYDAGLQLSFFDNTMNIYIPVFVSKVYTDYSKSIQPEERFWRTISFSIDVQRLKLKNFSSPQLPFEP